MGLPEGWVTGVCDAKGKPLAKTNALKILGNGVVMQQAAAAVGHLLGIS